MIANPHINQPVRIHYRASVRHTMPHHGKTGIVRVVGRGKPRNHGVEVEGVVVVVPCGNLVKVERHA